MFSKLLTPCKFLNATTVVSVVFILLFFIIHLLYTPQLFFYRILFPNISAHDLNKINTINYLDTSHFECEEIIPSGATRERGLYKEYVGWLGSEDIGEFSFCRINGKYFLLESEPGRQENQFTGFVKKIDTWDVDDIMYVFAKIHGEEAALNILNDLEPVQVKQCYYDNLIIPSICYLLVGLLPAFAAVLLLSQNGNVRRKTILRFIILIIISFKAVPLTGLAGSPQGFPQTWSVKKFDKAKSETAEMIKTVDVDADIAAWMQDYSLKSEILMSGKKIIPVTMYKDLAFGSNKSSGKQMLIYLGKGTAEGVIISKEDQFELFNLIHKTPDFCFGRKAAWIKDFNDRFYNKKVAFPSLGDEKRNFIHENNERLTAIQKGNRIVPVGKKIIFMADAKNLKQYIVIGNKAFEMNMKNIASEAEIIDKAMAESN